MFNVPSEIIIGLERHILQTIGFDFRVRYPQKLLAKIVRQLIPAEDAKHFLSIAYPMCIDIYKTFSPVKQTTFTMVMGVVELTALMLGKHVDLVRGLDLRRYHTSRGAVIETALDLLDLYTQFAKNTKVGTKFELDRFIDVKIKINKEVEDSKRLSRFQNWCGKCEAEDKAKTPITPGSATSPATTGSFSGGSTAKLTQKDSGTLRFVFDAEEAKKEQDQVDEYFKEEYEEYEVEVEEETPREPSRNNQGHGHGHGHHGPNGSRRDRGHGNHHDGGWNPYPRDRHHGRSKGRKGGGYY